MNKLPPSYEPDSDDFKARVNATGKLHALLCKKFKWSVSEVENTEGYLKGRFDLRRDVSLLTIHPGDIASPLAMYKDDISVTTKEVKRATEVVESRLLFIVNKMKENNMELVTAKKSTKKKASTKKKTVAKKKTTAKVAKKKTGKKVAAKKSVAKTNEPAVMPKTYPKPNDGEKVGGYTQRLLKSGKFSDGEILLILRKEFKDSNYTQKEISWNKWKMKQ